MNPEPIRLDILLESKLALAKLKEFMATVQGNDNKIKAFSQSVLLLSKEWQMSWQSTLLTLKQVNMEMSKAGKGTLFGNVGGQDLFAGTQKYMTGLQEAGRISSIAVPQINEVPKAMSKVPPAAEKAGSALISFKNVFHIAFGFIMSQLLSQVYFAFQTVFTGIITNLREAESAMYNLANAERVLSEAGVDVTPKGLDALIEKIQKLVPIISKIQAQELVSRIASNVAPAIGLSAEQVDKMATAVSLLYLKNKALGISFDEIEGAITNAFLTGKVSVGINKFGVKISEAIVMERVLADNVGMTEDAFKKLTAEQQANLKSASMLNIVYDSATKNIEDIPGYLKTADASMQDMTVSWSNMLTALGTVLAPIIKAVSQGLADSIKGWINALEIARPQISRFVGFVAALFIYLEYVIAHAFEKTTLDDMRAKFKQIWQEQYDMAMKGVGVDTPTGTPAPAAGTEPPAIDEAKMKTSIDDLVNDLDKLDQKAAETTQKFNELWANPQNVSLFSQMVSMSAVDLDALGREVYDHIIDMKRMWEDYKRDVAQVSSDYADKMASAERKYRTNEKNEEKRFQEQMRQLREKFLFALEDALRERDARQVLRLIRQYEMDKEAATNEYNLSKSERAKQHAEEMAQLAKERDDRLKQMADEYELKRQRAEEDYQLKKAREAEDFKRDMEELTAQRDARLLEFAYAIGQELGLKVGGAQALYEALMGYYGKNGMLDGMYKYSADSMISHASYALARVQAIAAQYRAVMASMGGGVSYVPGSFGNPIAGNMGGGGTGGVGGAPKPPGAMPTGANGFIPLGGGQANGFTSANARGGSGSNGRIEIMMTLSPDLEARVINNTLDKTANIVARLNNSKVR